MLAIGMHSARAGLVAIGPLLVQTSFLFTHYVKHRMTSIFSGPKAAFRIALVLAICSGPVIAIGQSNLKIPHGPEEYKELMKDRDGKPCTTCGVVAALRGLTYGIKRTMSSVWRL